MTPKTCRCGAVPWPHLANTVLDCLAHVICRHGNPMPGHPNFDVYCPECAAEAHDSGDYAYDRAKDARHERAR